MRPTPAACAWTLMAAVLLLAVLAEGGHHKRKKIVVFVPQKVKHIHHHHVKKVYIKRKPIEYIEDEDLHRAGEGDDGAWEQPDDDDKVAARASEHRELAVAPPEGLLWGGHGGHGLGTPAPLPSLTLDTLDAHVGRVGEFGDESIVTADGWTALHHLGRPQRPQQPQHQPRQQASELYEQRYEQRYEPGHSHGKQHRPQPARPLREQADGADGRHQARQPAKGRSPHPQESHHQNHHYHHHDPHHQQLQQLAEASETPESIRAWVNEGFEKFHNTHAKDILSDDEDVDDGIRVQVFQDGEEIPTKEVSPSPEPSKQPEQEPAQQAEHQHHTHHVRGQHSKHHGHHGEPRPKPKHHHHPNHREEEVHARVRDAAPAASQQQRTQLASTTRHRQPSRPRDHALATERHADRHADRHREQAGRRQQHIRERAGAARPLRPIDDRGPQRFLHDDALPTTASARARPAWRQR